MLLKQPVYRIKLPYIHGWRTSAKLADYFPTAPG